MEPWNSLPIAEDIAFRYEGILYSMDCDEFDNPLPGATLRVRLQKYSIVKRTPKGFWISYFSGGKDRFVLDGARKQFAHQSIEKAQESFIARKKRQIYILKHQLEVAEESLRLAEQKKFDEGVYVA